MAVATSLRVKPQRVTFHSEHVEAQTGVFFRKHVYARYDNVKKVESTQGALGKAFGNGVVTILTGGSSALTGGVSRRSRIM